MPRNGLPTILKANYRPKGRSNQGSPFKETSRRVRPGRVNKWHISRYLDDDDDDDDENNNNDEVTNLNNGFLCLWFRAS